jgi:hypothetical protein
MPEVSASNSQLIECTLIHTACAGLHLGNVSFQRRAADFFLMTRRKRNTSSVSLLFSFLGLEGPFETGTSAYSRRKRIFVNSLFLALFLIANGAWNLGQAQTAIFSGAYSSVPTSTLNYAYGTAVDSGGTVYITNSGFGQVLKGDALGGRNLH